MSASEAAAKVQPGSRVRWDRLERAAFVAHPAVLQQHPSAPWAKNNWLAFLVLLGGIPYFLGGLSPIGGAAILSGGQYQTWEPKAEDVVPIAGQFFIWTALSLIVSIVCWSVTGRLRHPYYELQAWLAVVLGALTAGAVAYRGSRESFERWTLWVTPIVVAVILAVVFLFLLWVADGAKGTGLRLKGLKILRYRQAQVAQLSEDERAAIQHDIDACIDDLEERGLVSASDAERARCAELGALALRMPRAKASKQLSR